MSSNLLKQFPKLEMIAEAKKPSTRKALLIAFADDPLFFKAVRELVKNTVKKNIKLNTQQRRTLIRYKDLLLTIMKKKKISDKRKKALMVQSGTGVFIPLIVPLVSAILSSLTQ